MNQTDHHTEDTQFAELANQDELDGTPWHQTAEDWALYGVALLAGLVIAAIIVAGY